MTTTRRPIVRAIALAAVASVLALQTPAQAALTSATLDVASGSVSRSGVVTISGSVTCNEPGFVYVYVYATQPKRDAEADDRSLYSLCSPTPTSWTMTFGEYIRPGTFKGGPANVTWNGQAFAAGDDEDVVNVSGTKALVLRRS